MSDIRGILAPGLMSARSRTNTPQGLLSVPSSGIEPGLLGLANDIFSKYQLLDKYRGDYGLLTGRPMTPGDDRQLESYPPEESWNPIPGKATTELFNTDPSAASGVVAGDFLHHLPSADPTWAQMRGDFLAGLTPEQIAVDKRAHAEAQAQGDPRPFNQWMDTSRGDQYIIAGISPDKDNNWRNVFTPEQRKKLGQMADYLIRGSTAPGYR